MNSKGDIEKWEAQEILDLFESSSVSCEEGETLIKNFLDDGTPFEKEVFYSEECFDGSRLWLTLRLKSLPDGQIEVETISSNAEDD